MKQELSQSQIGRYQIQEALDRQGVVDVYLAVDPSLNREVVIKALEPANSNPDISRFSEIARSVAQLNYPAIVPLLDFGAQDGLAYFVTSYLSGGSLAYRLQRGERSPQDAPALLTRLGQALDYAHRAGIVHKAISPSKILFDADGTASLADFGLADMASALGEESAGNPLYLSPETFQGDRTAGPSADLYSLAVIAFELLAGENPFNGSSEREISYKHVSGPVPDILRYNQDLPGSVQSFFRRALAKNPDERFTTAAEMAGEFERSLSSGGTASQSPPQTLTRFAVPEVVAAAPARRDAARFKFDVSIQHSPDDKDWVQGWLAPRLEMAGLRVSIASRGGLGGFFNRIRESSDSQFNLFVVSRADRGLTNTRAFISAALGRMKAGAAPDSVLLMKEPVELSEAEQELPRLDFSTPDLAEQNLPRLVAALQSGDLGRLQAAEPARSPVSQTIFQEPNATPSFEGPAASEQQLENQAAYEPASNNADNPVDNIAAQTVVTNIPEPNAPNLSSIYQQRPPVESAYSQDTVTEPPASPEEAQQRTRLENLRDRLRGELSLEPVFRQAIEDNLGQAEAGLQSGNPDGVSDRLTTAENMLAKWASQTEAWRTAIAGLNDLRDQVKTLPQESAYIRWLAQRLEQVEAETPGMENAEVLNRALEEASRQIARYRDLQQKLNQVQDLIQRVPPSKGFYPPETEKLRYELDSLTPVDEEPLKRLDETLQEALSDLSQRLSEYQPTQAYQSPVQANMPATQQAPVVDPRQRRLQDALSELRAQVSADRELPEIFGQVIAPDLDAAEKSLVGGDLAAAQSALDQARSAWDRWGKERNEWLEALNRFADLKRTVSSLPGDGSNHLGELRQRLEELDLRSAIKRSATEFGNTLNMFDGRLQRYQAALELINRLEAEQDRLPLSKADVPIDFSGLRDRLFKLGPYDDDGFLKLREEIGQAASEIKQRTEQAEKAMQAEVQQKQPDTPEVVTAPGNGQPLSAPVSAPEPTSQTEVEAPVKAETTSKVEPTTEKPRKPTRRRDGGTSRRPAEAREIIREIRVFNPPAPPPEEDCISLEVNRTEVVLTLVNGQEYRSLNLLDHAALDHEENFTPKQYGEKLFAGLFNDRGSPGFEERPTSLGYAAVKATATRGMRVELRVDREHPLYQWEYLKDPLDPDPLAINENTPFLRLHSSSETKPAEATPIRILFALCNPLDLGKPEYPPGRKVNPLVQKLLNLDLALERQIIQKAMEPLVKNNLAQYEILSGPETGPVTLDAIQEKLQEGFHVLHLLAHGVYVPRRQAFYLVLEETAQRLHSLVPADDFSPTLLGKKLRLIVLAACQSGSQEFGDPFQALAPRLVEKKIPAVIAMQSNLPVEAAQIFTQRFYGDLARSGRIDMAMAATRHDLYQHDKESWTWGIPILIMNTGEGRLFKVDEAHARTVERPAYEDLKIKGYDELGGLGDPAPRLLAQAIENDVRRLGFGQDSALLSALRAVVAPNLVSRPEPEEPLAKKQDRGALSNLARKVDISASDLEAYVLAHSQIRLDQSAFHQIASALNAGKHIILIGPPGTGKTSLCQDLCRYAQEKNFNPGFVLSTASADWTTFDTIGGYVPTRSQTLQFRTGIFLESISSGKWLVIDEINRAEIDKAFGELFTVLSGQEVDLPFEIGGEMVRVLPPAKARPENAGNPAYWVPASAARHDHHYVIHPNWRIIGTMNVYDKSSLFQMSFAFMRRFAFIDVDLPSDPVCFELVDRWLSKAGDKTAEAGLPFDQLSQLQRQLRRLISRGQVLELQNIQKENPLMERRALGPAIIKDMIEYIGDRRTQELKTIQEKDLNDRRLAMEAFLLYVVPQLDGLDYDGIIAIYQHIKTLFSGVDDEYRQHILGRVRLLYPHIKVDEWDKTSTPAGQ